MAIVVFVLGLCFAAMGLISLYFGYDLGGTERGVAYTISGSVALAAAGLLVGLSTVTARLGALVKLLRERPVAEAPLPGMIVPPAYAETPRPVMPVQRPAAPEPDASHPVPSAATPPLAPVLAGGAAAVATAATMDLIFRKDAESPKLEPEHKHDPAPPVAAEPAFDFEQALARELARPQPEISPLPAIAEPAHLEAPAVMADPELWDVKAEPVAAEPEAAEPVDHHHDHIDIPDLDAEKDHEPAAKPETVGTLPVTDRSADWLTAPEAGLRSDDARTPSADLPDDVFDDVFEHKPAPAAPEPAMGGPEPADDHAAPAHPDEPIAELPAAEEERHSESSVLHSPEPEPESAAPAEPLKPIPMPTVAAEDPGRKVIGSYSVGSNNYTMYADGSVEAHTETGLYRFASLDELRHFIEKGTTTPVE